MFEVPEDVPAGAVCDALTQLHALECATRASMLSLVRNADATNAWEADGAGSTSSWVAAHFNMSSFHSSELVRIARALGSLPQIGEVFEQGLLSWDQLVEVTKLADAESDAHWAQEAQQHSVYMLRQLVSLRKPVPKEDERTAHEKRFAELTWDQERLGARLSGYLPADMAIVAEKAIERELHRRDRQMNDELTGDLVSFPQMRADILVDFLSASLGADPDPARATISIHADFDDFGHSNALVAAGPVSYGVCDVGIHNLGVEIEQLCRGLVHTFWVPRDRSRGSHW